MMSALVTPFSLVIGFLPLLTFHFGSLFLARRMERILEAPSPGQPSQAYPSHAWLCGPVKASLKPELVAGREDYISLNDTERFVGHLLYA